MSQAPSVVGRRRGPEAESADGRVIDSEHTVQTVLDALDDPDCRAILGATSDGALTASELSEACDLALSTAYRKVDMLTEAGLLDERTRIRSSGAHTSEYAREIEDVVVSLGEATEIRLG